MNITEVLETGDFKLVEQIASQQRGSAAVD